MEIVEFKDYPNTETPLNAHNLNRIQNNILKEGIIVSPTEPTTNRRKVWLQKGKNLINRTISGLCLNDNGGTFLNNVNWFITEYIPIKPNEYYISQGINSVYKAFYDKNKNFISSDNNNPSLSPQNAYYVVMNGRISDSSNMMLEQGSIVTAYEEYIEPKMYVLNDNNVYEEFIKKEEKKILYYNSNGSNENITLSDSAENYDRLKIYYYNNDGVKSSIELEKPNNATPMLIAPTSSTNAIYYKHARYNISNTTMSLLRFGEVTIGTTNTFDNSVNKIYVTKVVGYKD